MPKVKQNSTSTNATAVNVGYEAELWQVAGPTVALSDSHRATPTFTAPLVSAGGATLRFQLVVSDGQALSAPATVPITVRNVNDPPTCALARHNRPAYGPLTTSWSPSPSRV